MSLKCPSSPPRCLQLCVLQQLWQSHSGIPHTCAGQLHLGLGCQGGFFVAHSPWLSGPLPRWPDPCLPLPSSPTQTLTVVSEHSGLGLLSTPAQSRCEGSTWSAPDGSGAAVLKAINDHPARRQTSPRTHQDKWKSPLLVIPFIKEGQMNLGHGNPDRICSHPKSTLESPVTRVLATINVASSKVCHMTPLAQEPMGAEKKFQTVIMNKPQILLF